jgi:hypothetical protein
MTNSTKQTSSIIKRIKNFPTTLVEVNITQSILSSKLASMDKSTIEMIVNTIIHLIKNVLDKTYDKIDCIGYRIDTLKNDFFSYDHIQHRLIFIGNGFEKKLPVLKEKLKTFVKTKMGDPFSMIVREEQDNDEVYTYFKNQVENTSNKKEFISDKMLKFYHSDLYSISEQGWHILNPKELKSSFVVFE